MTIFMTPAPLAPSIDFLGGHLAPPIDTLQIKTAWVAATREGFERRLSALASHQGRASRKVQIAPAELAFFGRQTACQ
jgi:hypothetical protein